MGEIDDPEKDRPTGTEGENDAEWLDELDNEPTNLLRKDPNALGESGKMDQHDDQPPEWLVGELAQDMPEEESVPDWLRDEMSAGAAEQAEEVEKEKSGEDIETTAIYDRAPTIPAENVPDWLRDQQPVEGSAAFEAGAADDLSWLDQIAAGAGAAIDEPPTLSWDEADTEPANQEESADEEDMTWLDDVGTLPGVMPADLAEKIQEAQVSDSMPPEVAVQEINADAAEEIASEDIAESVEPAAGEFSEFPVEPSEVMEDMAEEVPEDPDEAMAWLEQLAARQGAREEELPTLSEDTAPSLTLDSSEIPEDPDEAMAWLEKMAAEQDEQEFLEDLSEGALTPVDLADGVTEGQFPDDDLGEALSGLEEIEMPDDFDEALSWLEDMVMVTETERGPEAEEVILAAEMPVEELVVDFPPVAEQEPAFDGAEAMSELEVEPSLEFADPGDMEVEEDSEDAMAWLEQLAARQGADLEELTTVDSDEGEAEAPEWLRRELDEALDEAGDEKVVDFGVAAAGYSLEKLLEAEEIDADTFDKEPAEADEIWDLSQVPESELVDEVVKDLEDAEELITEAEFLEEVAEELEFEAEELEIESQELGAEATLLAITADDIETDADLEDAADTELEVEATIFQLAAEELQSEAIELEVEAIIFEDEAEELETQAEAIKMEAEAKMADAEELISEIEEREADEELAWLETLGKVDAASWLEAEAEASSPDLVVLEAAADMDSALDRAAEIEIEEEAKVLFGDAESILDSEYLNSARQAMESGELDSALEAYSHLLDKGEGLPYLIAELEYSIDSYGQQPLLQRLLGDTYVRNGQLKKAVEVYRQALDNI